MRQGKRWLCGLAALLFIIGMNPARADVQFMDMQFREDVREIDFGTRVVRDMDGLAAFLARLPALRRVDMYQTPISGEQADRLAARFPQIEFGWTLRIRCKDHNHDIRTDATAFSTLHNKRSPRHSSDDFRMLKYCKRLLALDIGHNKVTDLDFLYDLPQLRVLIIAINEITDITPLAALHDLQYAEIFKNKIEDLSPLSGLDQLVDLNIAFNAVSDWTPLYPLKGVERLWIYSSSLYGPGRRAMTDEVVSALKAELSETYIDSTHYSTTGGWREHPRYDVIAQMFKTGTYIPFSKEKYKSQKKILFGKQARKKRRRGTEIHNIWMQEMEDGRKRRMKRKIAGENVRNRRKRPKKS